MSVRSPLALVAGLLLLSAPALASEGAMELRDGDTVRGQLQRCGDVHLLEAQLARGDRLRFSIDSVRIGSEPIHVRVVDPNGRDAGNRARVRVAGTTVQVGPFRANVSGVWRLAVSTSGLHDLSYEADATIQRRKRRSVGIGKRGKSVDVPGGALLRLKARGDASVAITTPEGERLELHPGDAQHTALFGEGLSAPIAGRYLFEPLPGTRRLKLRVQYDRNRSGRTFEFPSLIEDRPTEATWVDGTGWVLTDRNDGAPNELPKAGAPHAWTAPLPVVPSTSPLAVIQDATDPLTPSGPRPGIGLPIAGVPDIVRVLEEGVRVDGETGPEYVLVDEAPGTGPVERRVRFLIEGRQVAAPLAMGGRMCIDWSSTGDRPYHRGDWRLTLDEERGLTVLDGGETWIDSRHRTLSSSAQGFSLRGDAAWPSGTLTWGIVDPAGPDVRRVESYEGDDHVNVRITEDGVQTGSGVVDLR